MQKRSKNKLSIYRRHASSCKLSINDLDKCECPLWVHGQIGGKRVRTSLETRSLAVGDMKRREMLNPLPPEPPKGGLTLVGAPHSHNNQTLEWAEQEFARGTKNKSAATQRIYAGAVSRFRQYAEAHGVTLLRHVTTGLIADYFRENAGRWNQTTRSNGMTQLRVFFNHAVEHDWIPASPAKKKSLSIRKPKLESRTPFTPDEISRIFRAVELLPAAKRDRARALVFLLLYSGMRISDAVFLERASLTGNALNFTCIKTRKRLDFPLWLHQDAVDALAKLPPSRIYFFVSDRDDDYRDARYALHSGGDFAAAFPARWFVNQVEDAARLVHEILVLAGLRQKQATEAAANRGSKTGYAGKCHRFRDTFAVNLLTAGADIFTVSKFLGHSDVRITDRHYTKLVKGYAEALSKKTQLLNYPIAG